MRLWGCGQRSCVVHHVHSYYIEQPGRALAPHRHRCSGAKRLMRTSPQVTQSWPTLAPAARDTSHWRERHGLPRNADRPQILLSSLFLSALARRFQSRFSLRARFSDNGTLERSFSTCSKALRAGYRGRFSAIPHELGTVKAYPSPTAFGDIKGAPSRENVSTR